MAGLSAALTEARLRGDGATVYVVRVVNNSDEPLDYISRTEFESTGSSGGNTLRPEESTYLKVIVRDSQFVRFQVRGQGGGVLFAIDAGPIVVQ